MTYAGIARSCGVEGVQVTTTEQLTDELNKAIRRQMMENKTTFIEVVLNQELGEPFRRDAMKKPVSVAGISRDDMRSKRSA